MTESGSASRTQRVLALPLAFTLLLAAFGALPPVYGHERLLWSFWGAAAVLLVWTFLLFLAARGRGRTLTVHRALRRPHWVQPVAQGSVYLLWGWYWREVYHAAYLILAQIVFAYAFDMLLNWSRRDDYELGLGPFPIIFSINLFLWFRPDWFWMQFVMVAVGFAAKQLLRWTRDGRSAHIFNPSSFPLALLSVWLILSGTVGQTWGPQIAVTLGYPPHIYEFLFLVGIPVQLLFGVASMTMPAFVTAFALSAAYFAFTGSYYFFGGIPAPSLLGMTLLFTDPATAPRTSLGRVIYGLLYGASIFALYGLLEMAGQPTFYDKLLFVPVLNLGVRAIDRLAQSPWLARFDPARWWKSLAGRRRNFAFELAWAAVFAGVIAAHGAGDDHPASRPPFWQRACDEGRRNACRNLEAMETSFCDHGSGWACNEFGIRVSQDPPRAAAASVLFDRACREGFQAGCANGRAIRAGETMLRHAPPRTQDYEYVLDGKGLPERHTSRELLHRACEQGWKDACDRIPPESVAQVQPVAPEEGVLRMAGSGAMGPLARTLSAAFRTHPRNRAGLKLVVEDSVGTGGGIRAVFDGAADLGLVSRELTDAEKALGLELVPVATDAVVIAGSPDFPASDLASSLLLELFSGTRRNLPDGAPVTVLLRDPSESANLVLDSAIAGMSQVRERAYGRGFRIIYHDDAMAPALFQTHNSIGLASLALIHEARLRLKPLGLDGRTPTIEELRSGRWPLRRRLWLAARRERLERVQPFLDFAVSAEGRALIAAAEYLPVPSPEDRR